MAEFKFSDDGLPSVRWILELFIPQTKVNQQTGLDVECLVLTERRLIDQLNGLSVGGGSCPYSKN